MNPWKAGEWLNSRFRDESFIVRQKVYVLFWVLFCAVFVDLYFIAQNSLYQFKPIPLAINSTYFIVIVAALAFLLRGRYTVSAVITSLLHVLLFMAAYVIMLPEYVDTGINVWVSLLFIGLALVSLFVGRTILVFSSLTIILTIIVSFVAVMSRFNPQLTRIIYFDFITTVFSFSGLAIFLYLIRRITDISLEKAETEIERFDNLNRTLEEKVEARTLELRETNSRLEGIGERMRRYLPVQLVDSIISEKKRDDISTERRKITVFFSDIKDFTATTDSLEAEELSNLLNEYLTEMTAIANRWGGTIDKFVGDAVMVFFGAPESRGESEDALSCVKMAIEMQERMRVLREKWYERGIEHPLEIRIGINTGVATVGDFGAWERLSYTAIGGQVNLAARLESACEPGGILISHSTWALVKDEIRCERRDAKLSVKGIHRELTVYDVVL
ncbi:MAG TPA: adenylate/guanylate cyclase domain-containing protein [Spirochaetota bacterium]|nr:adenylate/guanylate cyclase domain-containing protein [Spirochaetota bacterium]